MSKKVEEPKYELKLTRKIWPNGMLSNNWTVDRWNGEPLLFNIPNCTVVFDYDKTFDNISITCNEFVADRLYEIMDECRLIVGSHDTVIKCIKSYRGSKQINLRLSDVTAEQMNIVQLLKKHSKVDVTFQVKGVSFVRHEYFLTLVLKDIKYAKVTTKQWTTLGVIKCLECVKWVAILKNFTKSN